MFQGWTCNLSPVSDDLDLWVEDLDLTGGLVTWTRQLRDFELELLFAQVNVSLHLLIPLWACWLYYVSIIFIFEKQCSLEIVNLYKKCVKQPKHQELIDKNCK